VLSNYNPPEERGMGPTITVVVPVYNRDAELLRALRSIQQQTFEDFECVVIDDASAIPVEPIVESLLDKRFVYARNPVNGGPYSARVRGYRMMRGDFLVALDSDDEARPFMLAQAVKYLREFPEVDGVAGMNVRSNDGRPLVRVAGGRKIVTPAEYVTLMGIPDCVGAVRRLVVDEWLQKRDDYFALESHQWLTFHLHHSMLFVDEAWVTVHVNQPDRISQRFDERRLDDYLKFLDEHLAYVEGTKAVVLDQILESAWLQLTRAGRKEDAARFASYMAKRGLSKWRVIARRGLGKVRRLLPIVPAPVRYLR
jgi:glycosyltransferase involved in cell wall biosynthesis